MPARRQSAVDGNGIPVADGRSRGKDGGKEKETFGCPFPGCGQSYSRMEYLKRHQRKHQDVRPFPCRDCGKAFARSDVLLRHRRRCHPTPPPPERSSHSPPAPHRGYPGVPISSSRTDARESSPYDRSRKHPRQSSGSSQEGRGRPRLEDDDGSSEGERYAESSRYGRENGMGNGGVYNMDNYYGGDNHVESSTYTPHLLPMFQQGQTYHNMHDQNHLEDASVLLSLSYPGGLPHEENNPTVQGQRVVPDWEVGQATINMMMEASNQTNRSESSGSAPTENVTPTEQAVLNEPLNPFLEAMSWSGAKEGNTPNDANAWTLASANPSPRPFSPFPLSSIFSPNNGFAALLNGSPAVNGDDGSHEAVKSILEDLAAYDVPQTRANPNPERPLLRLAHSDLLSLAGEEPAKNRFYIPPERFAGCYTIPHWTVPPLRTLSIMANRTFDTILNHFSFVHLPTFSLVDTAACLAFTICTVSGVRSGKQQSSYANLPRHFPYQNGRCDPKAMDGPVPPGQSWECMYKTNYQDLEEEDEAVKKVEMWESGQILRNEKTNMLVKSFSLAQGVLMTEYNVALLQALILYHAPYFLSEDENERSLANTFLSVIINITRQIGFFVRELEHFDTAIQVPRESCTPNEVNLSWRQWIQLETRRRTAYLVYHLDTVSGLESNIPCILSPCEIAQVPLPAPDSLWKAETAEEWLTAVKKYRPMTLDEAMRRSFFLPTCGSFDKLHEEADTKYYNLLNQTELGAFARLAMILTLLRGVIDIGEGKRDRGDWRDLTDLWVSCPWQKPGKTMLASDGEDLGPLSEEGLRRRFAAALEKWRQGWDFDPVCPSAASSRMSNPGRGKRIASESPDPGGIGYDSGSDGEKGPKGNYCEEALPFYWLAQALLNIVNSASPPAPGLAVFTTMPSAASGGIKYGEMLKSARMFTRMGEGVVMCPTRMDGLVL